MEYEPPSLQIHVGIIYRVGVRVKNRVRVKVGSRVGDRVRDRAKVGKRGW